MNHLWPRISDDHQIQAAYEQMRKRGESHLLAEMLALGQPPASNTDREFLHGHANGNQFETMPGVGDYYKRIAQDHGQNPTGKVYKHSLARFPGDPEAWVTGKGDVTRLCEQRGWGCQGSVNVPLPEPPPPTGGGLATDLVDQKVRELMELDPEPRKGKEEELREQVIEQHAPPWAKREVGRTPEETT